MTPNPADKADSWRCRLSSSTLGVARMDYGITQPADPERRFIPISEERFSAVVAAKSKFWEVVGAEEKFDLFLENYVEFERELLNLTLRYAVFNRNEWKEFKADSRIINRRLANLLSAGKLYADQVQHDLSSALGRPAVASVKEKLKDTAGAHFSFRLLVALRNYFQHRGMPLRAVAYCSAWLPQPNPTVLEFRLELHLDTASLGQDSRFTLADELSQVASNFLVHIRDYVSLVGDVHKFVRELLGDRAAAWEAELRATLELGRAEFGRDVTAVNMVERSEEGYWVREEEVFTELIDYLNYLRRKNGSLVKLASRAISSHHRSRGDA